MPSNIEIKFRCEELDAIHERAIRAGASDEGRLNQTDTFYSCASGRLKLRDFGVGDAELIWYRRTDAAEARASEYRLAPVTNVAALHAVLSEAFGQRVIVRKQRRLLLWRNVRIHLDRVESLGDFVELESVVGDVDAATARVNLHAIVEQLGLREATIISVAYADLL